MNAVDLPISKLPTASAPALLADRQSVGIHPGGKNTALRALARLAALPGRRSATDRAGALMPSHHQPGYLK